MGRVAREMGLVMEFNGAMGQEHRQLRCPMVKNGLVVEGFELKPEVLC